MSAFQGCLIHHTHPLSDNVGLPTRTCHGDHQLKVHLQVHSQLIARTAALLLSLAVLVVGLLYYGLYRQHALPMLLAGLPAVLPSGQPLIARGLLGQSIPSLTHALSMMLMLHALLPTQSASRMGWRILILATLLAGEWLLGTPDMADVAAILLGVVLAELLAWRLGLIRHAQPRMNRLALAALVSFSGLLAAGTSPFNGFYSYTDCARYDDEGYCLEYKKPAEPVYLTYRQLRDAFALQSARPLDQLGRIYLYGDFIFLNERNQGLHIIDNRNPQLPVNAGFLRIPGNTEVAIRDNYLYADSYVDLITLDLNDPSNIQLVSRQEDIFPYDAFQNIPYNISFRYYDTDASQGVVVGYRLTDD